MNHRLFVSSPEADPNERVTFVQEHQLIEILQPAFGFRPTAACLVVCRHLGMPFLELANGHILYSSAECQHWVNALHEHPKHSANNREVA